MSDLVSYFFSTNGLSPQGQALVDRVDLVALHALGDGVIGFAFLAIGVSILYPSMAGATRARRRVILIFASFLGFCALSHFLAALTLWIPIYGFEGVVKLLAAIVSVSASIIVVRMKPGARASMLLAVENAALKEEIELRKAAEARLRERELDLRVALERARNADKAKTAFLASMSHDLRTPLNAIIGYSDAMIGGFLAPDDDGRRAYLKNIRDSGSRLLTLVSDLLDVSKIATGQVQCRFEILDPIETIRAPLRETSAFAIKRDISIDFLDQSNDTVLVADGVALRRIVANLLDNAVRHARSWVQVSCLTDDEMMRIQIEDDGPGILVDGALMTRDPYVVSGAEGRGGGLGLAIVENLCRAHGGELRITRGEAGGALVEVSLPLRGPQKIMVPSGPEPQRRRTSRPRSA